MSVGFDSVLLLLHVMFFCYWLGTDLGVFYSARFMMRADISVEARQYCAKIMNFLDQAPRVSMPGILVVGASLGILRGYINASADWILPIWIIGILWVAAVIYLYINEHHPEKIKTVKYVDFRFRVVMTLFLTYLGVSSLMGVEGAITSDNWLAAKILVFAACMASGVMIRVYMKDFGQYYGPMLRGNATPEQISIAQGMMANAKIFVLCIWGLLVIAAALGLWKPF
ncbi:MAG: hypothetical protein JNK21_02640 [Rhodospirillaceae bacterium]|nr:hypothetical protein [Rhodospirillaceae bacterium]